MRSNLVREVYALGEMIGHMALMSEYYAPLKDVSPGMIGFEDCESPPAHIRNMGAISEKYPVRQYLGIQQDLNIDELDNGSCLPAVGNSPGGAAAASNDMVPLLITLQSSSRCPGASRPSCGLPSQGTRNKRCTFAVSVIYLFFLPALRPTNF